MALLTGKVALVTGAGGTMGRAVVAALVADGCHVGLVDLNEAALAPLRDAFEDCVCPLPCDIGDPQASQKRAVGSLKFPHLGQFM